MEDIVAICSKPEIVLICTYFAGLLMGYLCYAALNIAGSICEFFKEKAKKERGDKEC